MLVGWYNESVAASNNKNSSIGSTIVQAFGWLIIKAEHW